MPDGNLYHDDFHAWALDQAERLRAASHVQAPELEGVDFEHVIEEVEDLGNSERLQVASLMSVAIAHLIKIAALPGSDAVRGWEDEINATLTVAARRYRASMAGRLDMEGVWEDARNQAIRALKRDGITASDLPASNPFTLEQLVDRQFDIDDLAAIMARAMP